MNTDRFDPILHHAVSYLLSGSLQLVIPPQFRSDLKNQLLRLYDQYQREGRFLNLDQAGRQSVMEDLTRDYARYLLDTLLTPEFIGRIRSCRDRFAVSDLERVLAAEIYPEVVTFLAAE